MIDRNKPDHITRQAILNMMPENLWRSTIMCSRSADFGRAVDFGRAGSRNPGDPSFDAKDKFEPALTMIFQKEPGQRLWIGGSKAADNQAVLQAHGIKAKLCAAGTVGPGAYEIVRFNGIMELKPAPVNKWLKEEPVNGAALHRLDDETFKRWYDVTSIQEVAQFLWGPEGLARWGDILIYCAQGANRSSALLLGILMYLLGLNSDKVSNYINLRKIWLV